MTTFTRWQARNVVTGHGPVDRIHIEGSAECSCSIEGGADPISDAVNNFRVACSGSARRGFNRVEYELLTQSQFIFKVETEGGLFANVCFAPQGSFTLFGKAPTWFAESPGFAWITLRARMQVEVTNERGEVVRDITTPRGRWLELLSEEARAGSADATVVGSVSVAAYDEVLHRDMNVIVRPGFFVDVFSNYKLRAAAENSGGFAFDFGSFNSSQDPPGDGLNVPFASISIV